MHVKLQRDRDADIFFIPAVCQKLFQYRRFSRCMSNGDTGEIGGFPDHVITAAEIIGTPPLSVGKMIYQSKIWLDTDDLFAWTVILVVLSVLFEKCITSLLKRFL